MGPCASPTTAGTDTDMASPPHPDDHLSAETDPARRGLSRTHPSYHTCTKTFYPGSTRA
jgi:hypothetical protein